MGFLQLFSNLFKPKKKAVSLPSPVPVVAAGTPPAMPAPVHAPADDFIVSPGTVTVVRAVKIRKAKPATNADVVSITQPGTVISVSGYTKNGEKVEGNSKWYKDNDGNWFWSGVVGDLIIQQPQSSFKLTYVQFTEAAAILDVEIAAIKAVNTVESSGNGFLPDGRPKILFEGHIFWKELKHVNIDPVPLQAGNEDILYSKWDIDLVRPYYKMDQYQRLEKAKRINEDAALKSASWGAFQILGANHTACGYDDVRNFVIAQNLAAGQLKCFCQFLKSSRLDAKLRNLDWAGFAMGYNGASYAKNKYDVKLESAYDNFKA